jgi:hypothetical protein
MPRTATAVREPSFDPILDQEPSQLKMYRLDLLMGKSIYISATDDDDAIGQAFANLGIPDKRGVVAFRTHNGKQLVLLLPTGQLKVYPPRLH